MSLFNTIYYSADKHLKDSTLDLISKDKQCLSEFPALLDLGCGDCKFTKRLSQIVGAHWDIITVDAIDVRVGYSQSNNWYSIKADLNKVVPIESESIDVIHAGDVIEHLNDTDTFVKEIKRMLRPTGYAIISTPNLASWHNILWLILGKQPMTCMVSDEISDSVIEADKDMPKHRRIFTHAGLIRLLTYHGLKVELVKGCGYYPLTGTGEKIMSKLDTKHSAYVLVKVRKS